MSYILEALKKAQAERQLGNAPTIHAPTLQSAPVHVPAVKKTGMLALAAGVIVAVLAGGYFWSQRTPAPAAVPVVAAVPAAVAAPAAAPAPIVVPTPGPAPVVVQAPPVTPPRKAVNAPAPAPAPVQATAATEDNVRFAKDLPQEIQQQLPRVGFGGYMYSDNAADRLVLVDKTLRHEGEEIAPGLMLEKLLPRGAILNFRGTRYRVAF